MLKPCFSSFLYYRIYSVKPLKGLVEPQQHQVFTVKIVPKEVKTYKHTLRLNLNDAEKNQKEIQVWGSAESADVFLENRGELYFKPTCVGTESMRGYAVKNMSRIPLRFEWKLTHEDGKTLSVEPECGLIQPNESQVRHLE